MNNNQEWASYEAELRDRAMKYVAWMRASGLVLMEQHKAISDFILGEIKAKISSTRTTVLDEVIKGTNIWAKKAWEGGWVDKKHWYDEGELAGSIQNHIEMADELQALQGKEERK